MNVPASLPTIGWLDREFCVQLTSTLLHLIWEGFVLLGVSAIIAAAFRRRSANLRYAMQLGTLVALAGCFPLTYFLIAGKHGHSSPAPVHVTGMAARTPAPSDSSTGPFVEGMPTPPALPTATPLRTAPGAAVPSHEPGALVAGWKSAAGQVDTGPGRMHLAALLPQVAPCAVALYLLGVLSMALRLLTALWGGHRLRAAAIPATESQLLELVTRETHRLGLRFVPAVAWSWQISTPVVVGVLRPTILLPTAAVTGLSPDDLAGILLHELAHIRRLDLIVNLFQRLIEALLFFHPAVWFVSRQVSRERENCCDDCVVSAGWQRTTYAELLVRVAEVCAASSRPIAAAAGTGLTGDSPSELKRRVLRLLAMEPRTHLRLSRSGVLWLGALLMGAFSGTVLLEGREPDAQPEASVHREAADKHVSPEASQRLPEPRGRTLHGMVLTPDGKPAAGAQVAIANWSTEVQFLNAKLAYVGSAAERKLTMIETDAAGKFQLPKESDPQAIVVAHASGYAEVDDPRRERPAAADLPAAGATTTDSSSPSDPELRIALKRYGRIIGTLRRGDKPVVGVRFQIASEPTRPYRCAPSWVSHMVDTDDQGRFVSARMPPGPAWCQRCVVQPDGTKPLGGLLVHFDVVAGEVTNLALGGPGPTVKGMLRPPKALEGRITWPNVDFELSLRPPPNLGFGGLGLPGKGGMNDGVDPWGTFLHGPEGQAYVRKNIPIAADGTFRIEGLPPADYVASITFPGRAVPHQSPFAGESCLFPIRVSARGRDGEGKGIDLGTIPLMLNLKAGGVRRSIPASDQPQKPAQPDDKAQAIALRAHRGMQGVDALPRFYLRTAEGNGAVDTLRDTEGCTIDGLKRAIDGPVHSGEGYFDSRVTLAWDGRAFLWGNATADILRNEAGQGQFRFWSPTRAWERSQHADHPPDFVLVPKGDQLAESITYNGIFRLAPHRFWWGAPSSRHDQIDPIPTELGAYRTVGEEVFDGELCDVVDSIRRCERLWVSRQTGWLRGVVKYHRTGQFSEGLSGTLRMLPEIFKQSDEPDEARAQTLQIALQTLDDYSGPYEPNELVCFRDFRQIAPDVWFPFREDRAFTHSADSNVNRRKYIRLWWSAEEVRTDVDLTATIQTLQPKEGDRISQDQRFGLPLTYDYHPNRTPRELLELVQRERYNPQFEGFLSMLTFSLEKMAGEPARVLPAEGWIGGAVPRTHGTPHLLHFWAEWASPSLDDFPSLKELAGEGATILGIHPAGTPAAKVAQVMAEHQLKYPTLLATENSREHFNQRIAGYPVWAYPHCVLIDAEGRIAAQGPLTPALLERFRELRQAAKK